MTTDLDTLHSFVRGLATKVGEESRNLDDPKTVEDTLQQTLSVSHYAGMLHTLEILLDFFPADSSTTWPASIGSAREAQQQAACLLMRASLLRIDEYIDDQLTSTVVLSANRQN